MNNLIADNKVKTMFSYLTSNLKLLYDEREAGNIAEVMFDAFKGWRKSDILLHENTQLSESEMLRFHFALKKLKQHIPVQYAVGEAWFYGLRFFVDSSVLIPRPETEELVHLVLSIHKNAPSLNVLDIGTGSGCIPIALKCNAPHWQVQAIDVSKAALDVAQRNATELGVQVGFHHIDILNQELPEGNFNVIVSNPPYIPKKEASEMSEHVKSQEPSIALFVDDENPLVFYTRILQLARQRKSISHVYFEIHHAMKPSLQAWMENNHFLQHSFHQDMQGMDRMLVVEIN